VVKEGSNYVELEREPMLKTDKYVYKSVLVNFPLILTSMLFCCIYSCLKLQERYIYDILVLFFNAW